MTHKMFVDLRDTFASEKIAVCRKTDNSNSNILFW